jgi:hypothetical protein
MPKDPNQRNRPSPPRLRVATYQVDGRPSRILVGSLMDAPPRHFHLLPKCLDGRCAHSGCLVLSGQLSGSAVNAVDSVNTNGAGVVQQVYVLSTGASALLHS